MKWLSGMLMILLLSSGCASTSSGRGKTTVETLPDSVFESFDTGVNDSKARRYLESVEADLLPPDRRLEVIILRQLASLSDEKDLTRAFDHLWEQELSFRDLLEREKERSGFFRPLAETYYLLSAIPGSSWHLETAERLYQKHLKKVKPEDLSGYSLHFFTFALLKNGEFDTVLPFLQKMEHFNPAQIYVENLTLALTFALDGKAYPLTAHLLAHLCRIALDQSIALPEPEISAALLALQADGKLDLAREALAPVAAAHMELNTYGFMKLLRQPVGKSYAETPGIFQSSIAQLPYSTKEANDKQEASKLPVTRLGMEIQVIRAGMESDQVDPELSDLAEDLKKTLNFSSLKLMSRRTLDLRVGERGKVALGQERYLVVTPLQLEADRCRFEVTVRQGQKKLLTTLVESINGGVTTLGEPKTGQKDVILIRISTFILKTDVARPLFLGKDLRKRFGFFSVV